MKNSRGCIFQSYWYRSKKLYTR